MKEKIGIVDVRGGLRGVYATGVLDRCLDEQIHFDLGIGVSAGSANLASYIAGQPRRSFKFYTEYAMRKKYMGFGNFLSKRSFLNLDYIYGTLSNSDGECPLDYSALKANTMDLVVVAEEARTGRSKYFTKEDLSQDHYDIFKASSAIPFVCKPYFIKKVPYYDGALADPIPIKKAFELGCDKIVLILTLPRNTVRQTDRDKKIAARIRKQYPLSAKNLEQRALRYNAGVKLAKQYEKQGCLLIIAPNDTCGISTLSRKAEALKQLYQKGYEDGKKIVSFLADPS